MSQQRRGYRVFVVDLERKEWFNVAKGLLTPAFWRSQCTAKQGEMRHALLLHPYRPSESRQGRTSACLSWASRLACQNTRQWAVCC